MLKDRPIRILSAFLAFAAVGLFVLIKLLASAALSWPGKLSWMLGFALLFLLGGCWAVFELSKKTVASASTRKLDLGFVLCAAYLAPLLIFRLPAFIDGPDPISPGAGVAGMARFNSLNGFPGSFLWPVGVLAVYLIGLSLSKGKWPLGVRHVITGIPAGVALWLASMFIFSFLSRSIPIDTSALQPWAYTLTALTALLLSPWVTETVFRVELWRILIEKAGPIGAAFLVALIYATLQFRLLFWLPAFLFSLGLSALYRRTGSLLAITAAHTIFNAFMLLLSIGFVL